MNRTTLIEERLLRSFVEIGAKPRSLTPGQWALLPAEEGNSRRMLGWTAPMAENGWDTPFCPQLIAESSAGLSDEDLEFYLQAIEYATAKEVVFNHLPAAERIAAADDAMLAIAEDSLRLISEVQLAVLDRRG